MMGLEPTTFCMATGPWLRLRSALTRMLEPKFTTLEALMDPGGFPQFAASGLRFRHQCLNDFRRA